jgi:hypothetical protein
MADSVRKQILSKLAELLKDIDGSGGYTIDIADNVERWDQRSNPLSSPPAIRIKAAPESKSPTPNPYFTCFLTVLVDVFVCQDDADNQKTDELLDDVIADVEKCIMTNVTSGELLDGLAKEILIKGNEPFEGYEGQAYAGVTIEVEIQYQHQLDDPTADQ